MRNLTLPILAVFTLSPAIVEAFLTIILGAN